MNKEYNNETITSYLLGVLPEPEAELFDELSFTDDDFADELKAAETDLVDAYINGELRGATLEQFKNFYLASPIRREKVKFAQAFQTFADKSVAEKQIIAESKPKRTLSSFFTGFFAFQRPLLQWSLALATLVLLLFGGLLFWENSRLRSDVSEAQAKRDEFLKRETELQKRENQLQNEIANRRTENSEIKTELAKIRDEREKLQQELKQSQQKQQIAEQKRLDEQRADTKKQITPAPIRQMNFATFLLTPSLRGNNRLQTVSIPAQTNSVKMRLELESDDYSTYQVALRDLSGNRILWQSGKIKSKSNGASKILSVGFPAKLLKSQIYSLQISGVSADGSPEIISDYSFKVVQ